MNSERALYDGDELARTVLAFCSAAFPGRRIGPHDELLTNSRVNSLFAAQIVEWIEHRFGVDFEPDDLELANFSSAARITRLVQRKLDGSRPPGAAAGR